MVCVTSVWLELVALVVLMLSRWGERKKFHQELQQSVDWCITAQRSRISGLDEGMADFV